MNDEFVDYDAIALGELIRKREILPGELLDIVIRRIERINPALNAVIYKMYDHAKEVSEKERSGGLFGGVPFLLKDLIAEVKGAPFSEGSKALDGYISKIDTEWVKRLKAGGLNIVGKTNTSEFGMLPTTEPALHGATANPWDLRLTPGGSSGGSASAVASGMVPMASGNDAGGSIRVPASCCGIFGLKPTRGRNPMGPLFGDIGSGIVHEHGLSRSVRDSAALLDVTSGPDLGDPYSAPPKTRFFLEEVGRDPGTLKIGFLTSIPEGWSGQTQIHQDCKNAVIDAAQLCEDLGHIVEPVSPEKLAFPVFYKILGRLFSCLTGHFVAYWEKELGKKIEQDHIEPLTWISYQAGLKRTGAEYLGMVEELQRFSRQIARFYDKGGYNILLSPTMSIPPPKLGVFQPTAEDPMQGFKFSTAFIAFTAIHNVTGQPAMSVPLFWNEGNVPIGVQFAGLFGDEATLFRLASQLEQARPWAGRKPPIYCGSHEMSIPK
jgi:amidase